MKENPEKRRHWQRHIDTLKTSGQTRKKYCEANQINLSTLDDWCRKLSPRCGNAVKSVLAAFPDGKVLDGIDMKGNRIKGRIVSSDPEAVNDIGGITLSAEIIRGPRNKGAILFTSPLAIRILKREPAKLSASIDSILRGKAQKLWTKHLPERYPEEQPSGFALKAPLVEHIEGAEGILTVLYPMDIRSWTIRSQNGEIVSREPEHDDRGSMFFIYSIRDKKIILAEFGHPEWSSGSTVRTVKPNVYFQIGNNPEIFFIGEDNGGWESLGHSLFNLRTGQEIMPCS
jgi:hypothetical protein